MTYMRFVIPQHFLFELRSRTKESLCGIQSHAVIRYYGLAERPWIPDKFPLAPKRVKEIFRNDAVWGVAKC